MAQWIERTGRCRALVASLGETNRWWRSQAMGPTGIRFLQRLYPRTAHLAAVETATLAARIDHDGAINSPGHFHLFRLPTTDEALIREWFEADKGVAVIRSITEMTPDQVLAELAMLAGREQSTGAIGPLQVGSLSSLRQSRLTSQMAAAYGRAANDEVRVYPYLVDTSK